jgi:uncharacterized RDD family membrane protein YckC
MATPEETLREYQKASQPKSGAVFAARYSEMSDLELLALANDRLNLIPEAVDALDVELKARQLLGTATSDYLSDGMAGDGEKLCPLCESCSGMSSRARLLYGQYVCADCSAGFWRRRALAHLIDELFCIFVVPIVLATVFLQFHLRMPILAIVSLLLLNYLLRDAHGLDIGKRLTGLEVIDTRTGKPTGFVGAFNRNLPLLLPIAPIVMAFQMRRGPRMGDRWAGTRVVLKKYRDKAPFNPLLGQQKASAAVSVG